MSAAPRRGPRQAPLKRVRVLLSLLFLFGSAAVFLDPDGRIPVPFISGVTFLQFTPSLLKFLQTVSIGAAGFLLALLLALLFGRVYCSTVCPLGTIQDIVSFLARRRSRRVWYREEPPRPLLQTLFLLAALVPALAGSLLVLNQLDPFSIFGRTMTALGLPLSAAIKSTAARILESVGIYAVYPAAALLPGQPALFAAFAGMGVVVVLAWRRGRLFCNTVCPVGTLLGVFSRAPAFRISVDAAHCTACGLCERACKAGCIDPVRKSVDMSRCVACCNCLTVCATDAIRYVPARHRPAAAEVDATRRDTVLGGLAFLLGSSGMSAGRTIPKPARPTTVPVLRKSPVAPPGAGSALHFTSTCTACHLCVGACPAHVLSPSFLEYGVSGILQPHLDFTASFCTYECTRCADVCPSGALLPLAPPDKKLTQLGVAKFIRDNCIVYTDEKECGACSEHCPTKAVRMVPYKTLVIPEVTEETCIGCGGCEHSCPTTPWRAIYVEGNPVHKRSRPPDTAPRKPEDVPDEFPF